MRIFNANNTPFYTKSQNSKVEGSQTKINKSNYDKITISNSNKNSEEAFAKDLSNKIMTEVRTPVTSSALEDLKGQIENNEYKIDIDNIIKHILLTGKDN